MHVTQPPAHGGLSPRCLPKAGIPHGEYSTCLVLFDALHNPQREMHFALDHYSHIYTLLIVYSNMHTFSPSGISKSVRLQSEAPWALRTSPGLSILSGAHGLNFIFVRMSSQGVAMIPH